MTAETSFLIIIIGFMGPVALIGIIATILARLPDKKHGGGAGN